MCFYKIIRYQNNLLFPLSASAHTGDQTIDEYPDISGITTARVS